ncbi:MAG: ABC transporter permease subunit [Methanobacteriota archaeon]
MGEANIARLTLHTARRLLLSLRGLLAILFSLWMVLAVAYLYDSVMGSGSALGELVDVFSTNPQSEIQWFLFDSGLTKLVTLFVAPMFVFDAVSGDRSKERLGMILSRPITRRDYILSKLAGASVAFGIIFFSVMALGFPLYQQKVPELDAGAYFATVALMYLLGVFSMCVVLMLSVLSRNNLISFIAAFGIMSVFMLPNASKYSSSAFMEAAKLTPHYYATYFTTHNLDALLYAGFALAIVAFSIPFLAISVWKFKGEDL